MGANRYYCEFCSNDEMCGDCRRQWSADQALKSTYSEHNRRKAAAEVKARTVAVWKVAAVWAFGIVAAVFAAYAVWLSFKPK